MDHRDDKNEAAAPESPSTATGWPRSFPLFGRPASMPGLDLDKLTWPAPPPWRPFTPAAREARGRDFLPDEQTKEMVNAALLLARPLLVTGRPGTGKSTLAYAVANDLHLGEVLVWPVNSRSTLAQGLYTYDAVGRLQDATLRKLRLETRQAQEGSDLSSKTAAEDNSSKTVVEDLLPDIGNFIRLGPLGTALLPRSEREQQEFRDRPRVLLIDEFDKSDIDLPNDLLNVLEDGFFEIPELKRAHQTRATVLDAYGNPAVVEDGVVRCTGNFPFVLITSNREREFPPAFLRRCLRLDIPDPQVPDLKRILAARLHREETALGQSIVDLAKEFVNMRDGLEGQDQRDLATDQLLAAAYVILQGGDLGQRPTLKAALLRSLKEG